MVKLHCDIGLLCLTRCKGQNGRIAINGRDVSLRLALFDPDGKGSSTRGKVKNPLAWLKAGLVDKRLLEHAFSRCSAHYCIVVGGKPMETQRRHIVGLRRLLHDSSAFHS